MVSAQLAKIVNFLYNLLLELGEQILVKITSNLYNVFKLIMTEWFYSIVDFGVDRLVSDQTSPQFGSPTLVKG